MESITTFGFKWPSWFPEYLKYVMAAVAVARLLTTRIVRVETAAAVALATVYCLVYRSGGYSFLLYLAILTVGFLDIDYRRILKTYLMTVSTLFCVFVLAGMLGVITNFVRIKDGLRSAWGISYPTDFASMGLFLLLALWVWRKKLSDVAMLGLCACHVSLSWFIAHSVNSTVCGALFTALVLYRIFEDRVIDRRRRFGWMKRGVNVLATIAFPLCALCIFALLLAYARGTAVGNRANALLSSRLQYQVEAWKQYGLKPFGTPFAQHGNGFSVFPNPNYNFVDSSYTLIVLRYGWVLFLAYCVMWGSVARRAVRCGDRRLLLALIVIAVHAISEHHFTDCHYNVLVVMPLAAYRAAAVRGRRRAGKKKRRNPQYRIAAGAAALTLLGVAAWLAGPAALSWIKTVLEVRHMGHGENLLGMFLALLLVLCWVGTAIWAVHKILRVAFGGRPARRCLDAMAALLACALLGAGAWWLADGTIAGAAQDNAAMIEADRQALEIAIDAATGKVYSGVLPAVYARSVDGVSYAAFFEDDLARLRGDTILMENDREHGAFFYSGYMYVPISEAHALYTGDRAVAEALRENGYRPTGYYSSAREVDLARASELNKLAYDPAAGLRLEGKKRVIRRGPYYDLYAGKYTATYELRLPEGSKRKGLICTLSISRFKGAEVLMEKEITADQFDEDGFLRVSIPFTIDDSRNVQFQARGARKRQVDIERISFVKTPDYDVHTFYNRKLKVEREEYYDLDGQPASVAGGYFAYENGFDRWGNIDRISYYDRQGDLTLCTNGYAVVKYVYNAKRQVIREEYYGTDGRLTALMDGQAIIEREYDAAGNVAGSRYYGVDGQPILLKSGYSSFKRVFDDDRRMIWEAYFGIDGQPIELSKGQAAIGQDFDDAGNMTARRYYGKDGALKLTTDGCAEVRWQYNGMHQVIREEFYGTRGEPVLFGTGQAANEREYDEAGNATVFRYYGVDGEPVMTTYGYAELHRSYNARNQMVREAYFGTDGEPIALYAGYAALENEYDDAGNVSVQRYYGTDGLLIPRVEGYAEVHWKYNGMRQIIREDYFGIDGQPTLSYTGQAANEREYDSAGNVAVYRYYGVDGQPAIATSGYAEVHRAYDEARRVIREAYYGTDGLPLAQAEGHSATEMEYDAMGNVAVQRYYDGDGRPVVIAGGYAGIRRDYDRDRHVIRESYFDGAGEPVALPAGHSGIAQEFDGEGNLISRSYLDAEGNAMTRSDGYARADWTLGEDGVWEVAFHDAEGREVPAEGLNLVLDGPNGWSRWYTPPTDLNNIRFTVATANLGGKAEGDQFTCQLEIEFRGAAATEGRDFAFYAQGEVDGAWSTGNVWSRDLVSLDQVPGDGICRFACTRTIDGSMAGASTFTLGFRCDYWAGGAFRVRSVKLEKGDAATPWTPGI